MVDGVADEWIVIYRFATAEELHAWLTSPARLVLVAEGDSWFDYPWLDVLGALEDNYGYEVEEVAHKGDRVEDMAYAESQLVDFNRKLEKVIRRGERPRAILLSGGGNDIAGDDFHIFLNHRASGAPGLNESVVAGIIDERLTLSYARIISSVAETSKKLLGEHLPVLVHGYGYAVPDGRGFWGGGWFLPGPGLAPGFERKGYHKLSERKKILRALIDRFNANLQELVALPAFKDFVHYVDVRPTLPSGASYQTYWADELHPTRIGFQRVAAEFEAVLGRL